MSDNTRLNCWPSCVCALDWSHEGILALASPDKIELLVWSTPPGVIRLIDTIQFPNIETQESDNEIPHWRHFPLQVPWFTNKDLPSRASAPLRIYSIGEEISNCATTFLAWSPPGIAKHRKCALATLTSNLVLSIWASDGRPDDERSWARRLIINHALEDYFSTDPKYSKNSSTAEFDEEEEWRLRRRVRAFTWAPALPTETFVIGTSIYWLQHMVAISNDDNQIVIVAVSSPTSKLWVDDDWSAEVIACCSRPMDDESGTTGFQTFYDIMSEQRYYNHLSWSPWSESSDGYHSVIAYGTNKDVRARRMSYAQGSISFGSEIIYADVQLRHSGPMTWSPEVSNGVLTLVFFTLDEMHCLSISASDASCLNRRSHPLKGRWDKVSGIAWDNHIKDHPRLHFSHHTTTTSYRPSVLAISPTLLKDISSADWPYWREEITQSQGLFSAEHDLKGHANSKVWGLCASPLGEYIATCHTVHPTDMIEYGAPGDRSSTIQITDMWGTGDELEFPTRAVSAESIFFTARKWIEKNLETAEDLPPVKKDIYDKLLKAYMPASYSPNMNDSPDGRNSMNAFMSVLKHNIFMNPNILRDRYEILASCICIPDESMELQRILIAFRTAKEIIALPSTLSENSDFSNDILDSHRQVIELVQSIMSGKDDDAKVDAGDEEADAEGEEDPNTPMRTEPPPPPPPAVPGFETCTFCEASIPFEDIRSGKCTNGHEFVRCGLSFLAIQEPGCTKYCGICETPYFAEEYIIAAECADEPSATGPSASSSPNRIIPVDDEDTELPVMTRDSTTTSMAMEGIESERVSTPQTVTSADEPIIANKIISGKDRMEQNRAERSDAAMMPPPATPNRLAEDEAPDNATPRSGTSAYRNMPDHDSTSMMDSPAPSIGSDRIFNRESSVAATPMHVRKATEVKKKREVPLTLASVLFLSCDACIYCGGKFVG